MINKISLIFSLLLLILIIKALIAMHKYLLLKEADLHNTFRSSSPSENPWVVITGASSGQGKDFALEFAKRRFNLLLIGSTRSKNTKEIINKIYPDIEVRVLIKDFRNAISPHFFNDIQHEIDKLNTKISIFINNAAYRTGWIDYHKMDTKYIYDTIAVKPITHSILTKMIIPIFLERKRLHLKSCLINVSAQCLYESFGLGWIKSNEISVPYLNVYEAGNAYSYYFTNSIQKEYGDKFDILNITPGAVITENTSYLKGTIFAIPSEKYVKNILKLIGNVTGPTCGYWGHALSPVLINLFPFIKENILKKVGKNIAEDFMKKNPI